MKRHWFTLPILCVISVLAWAQNTLPDITPDPTPKQVDPKIFVNKVAPDAELTSIAGRQTSVAAMKKSIVFIQFFLTWLEPDVVDLGLVERLHAKYTKKGLQVVMVTPEDNLLVEDFLSQHKYTFPIYTDAEGKAQAAYMAKSVPTTVIIGRDGKVVAYLTGPKPANEILRALKKAGLKMQ